MAASAQDGCVQVVPGRARNGEVFFSVLVKRSYALVAGGRARRAERDEPLRLVDSYYDRGDPEWSVVEHESDVAPRKAATDVVVIGQAHAPQGVPTPAMTVGVRVGERRKLLRVIGDRRCLWRGSATTPGFSDPLPFTIMPIRYDRAYGGRDERSDPNLPFFYPRNDMGRGVALGHEKAALHDLPLPNIEDPDDLLAPERVVIGTPQRWHEQPLPQGLGWRQRTWYPRSALLGAWPAFLAAGTVTAEERLQLLPANHVALAKQMRLPPLDEHFANGASLGLVLGGLKGDEPVALRGLSPSGVLDFQLPGDTPHIGLDLGRGAQAMQARLHTVSIRPDALALDMVWGGWIGFGNAAALTGLRRMEALVT